MLHLIDIIKVASSEFQSFQYANSGIKLSTEIIG